MCSTQVYSILREWEAIFAYPFFSVSEVLPLQKQIVTCSHWKTGQHFTSSKLLLLPLVLITVTLLIINTFGMTLFPLLWSHKKTSSNLSFAKQTSEEDWFIFSSFWLIVILVEDSSLWRKKIGMIKVWTVLNLDLCPNISQIKSSFGFKFKFCQMTVAYTQII